MIDHHIVDFAGRRLGEGLGREQDRDCECLLVHAGVARVSVGFAGISKFLRRHDVKSELLVVETPLHLFGPGGHGRSGPPDLLGLAGFAGPRVIGFSVHWHPQLHISLKLAELMKTLPQYAHATVVFGGITASCFAEDLLRYPFLDGVIQGDGERPLLELIGALRSGEPGALEQVPNLWYREAGQVRRSAASWQVTAELVSQNEQEVVDDPELFRRTGYVLSPGRGCPHACNFCGGSREAHGRWNPAGKIFYRSPEDIRPSVSRATDQGNDRLYLLNDHDRRGQIMRSCLVGARVPREVTLDLFGLPDWENIQALLEGMDKPRDFRLVLEISPETGSEEARRFTRGADYSNAQLEAAVEQYLQGSPHTEVLLFFSFFHTGAAGEWSETRRYVAHLTERFFPWISGPDPRLSIAFFPLSTDPRANIQRGEVEALTSDVPELPDYVRGLLGQRMVLGNFLRHRPDWMTPEALERHKCVSYLENVVRNGHPALYLSMVSWAGSFEAFDALLWKSFDPLWKLVLSRARRSGNFGRLAAMRMASLFGFWFFYDELPHAMFSENAPMLPLWLASLEAEFTAAAGDGAGEGSAQPALVLPHGERKPLGRADLGRAVTENLDALLGLSTVTAARSHSSRLMFTELLACNPLKAEQVSRGELATVRLTPSLNPRFELHPLSRMLLQLPTATPRETLLLLGQGFLEKLLVEWPEETWGPLCARIPGLEADGVRARAARIWQALLTSRDEGLCGTLAGGLFASLEADPEAQRRLRTLGLWREQEERRGPVAEVGRAYGALSDRHDCRLVSAYLRFKAGAGRRSHSFGEPEEPHWVVMGEFSPEPDSEEIAPFILVADVGELGARIAGLCDGTRTVGEIAGAVEASGGGSESAVRDALTSLYALQVLF